MGWGGQDPVEQGTGMGGGGRDPVKRAYHRIASDCKHQSASRIGTKKSISFGACGVDRAEKYVGNVINDVEVAGPERVLDRVARARDLGVADLGIRFHALVADVEVEVLDTPLLRRGGLLLLHRDGCCEVAGEGEEEE